MTQDTDIDIRELKDLILGLDKKTADLKQEIRVWFTSVENKFTKLEEKIDNLDTKLTGRIDTIAHALPWQIEAKFKERKKGFGQPLDGKELAQQNISTGLTAAIVGGLLLTLTKYLFLGVNP